MKTIKDKISSPFLTLVILVPLAVMILLNIVLGIAAERSAHRELSGTISGMRALISQQLTQGLLSKDDSVTSSTMSERLQTVRETLKASYLAANTEILIIARNGELLFPKSLEDSYITDKAFEKIKTELEGEGEGSVVRIRADGKKLYAVSREMAGQSIRSVRLVFVSKGSYIDGLIRLLNISLFIITALAVIISAFIAVRLSKSISLPITRLSEHAKAIGQGNFVSLPENNSSIEMFELTNSINEMSVRLSDYDRTQKAFLQNASHELRTPLMSIQGYAEGIAQGVFPDTGKTAMIICEESRRLNALVEQLLTLSRIDSKTYGGELEECNLPDMVKEYVQKINGYALNEGKELISHTQSEEIHVRMNDALLAQAVINILSNCIKYAKTRVDIKVERQSDKAVIRISDDGDGIPEKDLPHIFERFYKGKKGNFGLGLSIAKSAVEYMGGNIRAYNNKTGAVFVITLLCI
ncbi:MAG: ATP-binding protein [Eubacteriales bacterium]